MISKEDIEAMKPGEPENSDQEPALSEREFIETAIKIAKNRRRPIEERIFAIEAVAYLDWLKFSE